MLKIVNNFNKYLTQEIEHEYGINIKSLTDFNEFYNDAFNNQLNEFTEISDDTKYIYDDHVKVFYMTLLNTNKVPKQIKNFKNIVFNNELIKKILKSIKKNENENESENENLKNNNNNNEDIYNLTNIVNNNNSNDESDDDSDDESNDESEYNSNENTNVKKNDIIIADEIKNENEKNNIAINKSLIKYAKNLRKLIIDIDNKHNELLIILNTIFQDNPLSINTLLTIKELDQLLLKTKTIIKKLFLSCDNNYETNLGIFKQMVEEQLIRNIPRQIENLKLQIKHAMI